jgi:hypothetical protein
MFDSPGLRAITYQLTMYDVQSGLYNYISVLLEISGAGLLVGSKIEIMPFYMPLQDLKTGPVVLIVFRIVLCIWLLINTVVTLVSKAISCLTVFLFIEKTHVFRRNIQDAYVL